MPKRYLTRKGNTLTVIGSLPDRNGHAVKVFACDICSLDEELWPPGSISGKLLHIRNGKTPCACSGCPRWSQKQQELRIKRELGDSGLKFVKWADGGYANKNSKAAINCPKHGVYAATVGHLITSGSRCRKCHEESLISEDTESLLTLAAYFDDIEIVSLGDSALRHKSRVLFNCAHHGEWWATVDTFLRQKCRCPSCSPGGFKTNSVGEVYALKSECGAYIKIGITGSKIRRMRKLREITPFKFTQVFSYTCRGQDAREIEKRLLQSFESAGFKGFCGATEWLKFDPAIFDVLRELP